MISSPRTSPAGNKAIYDDFFPIIIDAFRYDAATRQNRQRAAVRAAEGFHDRRACT